MRTFLRAAMLATTAMVAASITGTAAAQSSIVLNTLWETRPTTNDYMTTNVAAERDLYTVRGAFAYIPQDSLSGTIPLYRLFQSAIPDHMTSTLAGEGGYTTEGALGNVWTSSTAKPGLAKLLRPYNPSTGDHAEVKDGDSLAGYSVVSDPGIYAYPRYNNDATVFDTLSAGGVAIKSNRVAGGILWSWVWNSTEFIDVVDYGRQMQTSVFWYENGVPRAPTEGGSLHASSVTPYKNQGSPLASVSTSGNTQSTRAVPLEWDPGTFGGDANHPVIYPDMLIGKDITLNFSGMGPVAKYVTNVTTASNIADAEIEAPIAYLKSNFTRFWTYDAGNATLTEVFPSGTCGGFVAWAPASGYGGVIISNANQTLAMGFYARTTAAGGTINYFDLINYLGCASTSALRAEANRHPLTAGTNTFNTYVTTETLSNVVSNMNALYGAGVS